MKKKIGYSKKISFFIDEEYLDTIKYVYTDTEIILRTIEFPNVIQIRFTAFDEDIYQQIFSIGFDCGNNFNNNKNKKQ